MRRISTSLAAALLGAGGVAVLAAPAHAAGTSYHVDCSATGTGDGSSSAPFTSLASANAVSLKPGDSMLFRRGVTCQGQFAPTGSGSASAPVVIGAYGDGTARPKIDANGATNAVLLDAFPYVTLQDLELTAPGDNTAVRRGLYVYASDAGTVPGITVQRLYVHDVRGKMPSTTGAGAGTGKYANATGGVVIEAQGTTTPTAFTGLSVLDNTIASVDRQGIYTWTNWCRRPELASFWNTLCSAAWFPGNGFTVRGNTLSDIGGDGIVVKGYDGALVEHNTLTGFNKRSGSPNAGMWTANSRNVTFQFNDASGGTTTSDGMGYDVDHSTDGIVFQYNLSHGNQGGFFLLCPYDKPTKNFTIRYNVSINDSARGFQVCDGALTGGKIYNNTIYIGNGVNQTVVTESTAATLDVAFTNNIVRKDLSGTAGWKLDDTNWKLDHNVLAGVSANPAWATGTITSAPLFVSPGTVTAAAYKLRTGSPALDAGAVIAGNGGRDYCGTAIPSGPPNIGFYQGPGL
ncbi:right-handed parallel beta-helix repeat-containing protein [Actinomadura rupiterrae]|uniref:right-handed parallel beta-helix repeat-containing protein n=1 Tax=Actinomadura rupiterrae TaxID=559627 RepID=UPI0020A5E66F|nr:right-handed parallel beta-helix repeat-containing protein [Actinomadura rupiterrae]MCP2341135.1 hypothetical protein [Actinomadura rupiterrae]